MKRGYLFFLFVLLFHNLFAQKTNGNFYIFKKDGSPAADLKKASFLQHVFSLNDSTFISRYYNFAGPMITQESFLDSNLTIPNGRFCWYNKEGNLDSTGVVSKGKKAGTWYYYLSKNETHTITYDDGIKKDEHTYLYDKKGKPLNKDSTSDDDDTTKHKLVKANFKSGIPEWSAYCANHLNTPERLQNLLGIGKHECMVSFIINKQGIVEDVYMSQSCEWSGDAEALRLITDSPVWQPATKDGKPVLYRQRQPLTYYVQRG